MPTTQSWRAVDLNLRPSAEVNSFCLPVASLLCRTWKIQVRTWKIQVLKTWKEQLINFNNSRRQFQFRNQFDLSLKKKIDNNSRRKNSYNSCEINLIFDLEIIIFNCDTLRKSSNTSLHQSNCVCSTVLNNFRTKKINRILNSSQSATCLSGNMNLVSLFIHWIQLLSELVYSYSYNCLDILSMMTPVWMTPIRPNWDSTETQQRL